MNFHRLTIYAAAAIAALCAILTGCESESSSSSGGLSVSPAFSKLRSGESVSLSASGCSEYRWSLENPAYGVLGATSGSAVLYTATRDSVTQVVTVKGTLGSSVLTVQATVAQGSDSYTSTVTPRTSSTASASSSSSSTASASSSSSSAASASSSSSSGSTDTGTQSTSARITISPTTQTLSNGGTQTFSASGGSGYTWTLSNRSLGELDRYEGESVTYTSKSSSGTQRITVSGNVGGQTKSATATVTHGDYGAGDIIP